MKNQVLFSVIFYIFLFTFSCTKKESDPNKIIAGETSKVWKAEKETNAEGDKEKLSKEEKNEVLQFYSNGTFSVNGTSAATQGTWSYEVGSKNLSLKFKDADVSENFEVVTLEKDKIKLKAADGSLMTLAADNY